MARPCKGGTVTTIKDVALYCGLSASTVSHVLNRTRRVSPETEAKVLGAVQALGYRPLRSHAAVGRQPAVGILLSNSIFSEQANIISGIAPRLAQRGMRVFTVSMPSGIRYADIRRQQRYYRMDYCIVFSDGQLAMAARGRSEGFEVPTLFFDQAPAGQASVLRNYERALATALGYLLRRGHHEVEVLCGQNVIKHRRALAEAAQAVFSQHGLHFRPGYLYPVPPSPAGLPVHPGTTALVSIGSDATSSAIYLLKRDGIELPGGLSLITVGDNAQIRACFPELTRLEFPVEAFAEAVVRHMDGRAAPVGATMIEPALSPGDSVLAIPRSPAGQRAASPSALALSSFDLARVAGQGFSVGIVLNNGETMFSQLMLLGVREMMESLGMTMTALGDAGGSFERHAMLLQDLSLAHPGALISVSNDHAALQPQLEAVAGQGIPLVLGTDVPANMKPYTYGTCIATNEPQKGRMAARYLAQQMLAAGRRNIGFLLEGNRNFSARQRDESALSTLEEEFPQLEVLFRQNLPRGLAVRQAIADCLQRYGEVEGLYIYSAPAAIIARDLLARRGRAGVHLVTTQINSDIALRLGENDMLTGIASSQPYEMGRALVMACAGLLLGNTLPAYVALDPVLITATNLDRTWLTTAKSRPPVGKAGQPAAP